MTYKSGELDQLIDIKRIVRADDGYGGDSSTPQVVIDDLYAHVRPINGREAKQYDKLNPQFTNLFVVRWRDDIYEDDTIVWEGDEYNIKSIPRAGGRKLYLEIYAERGLAT